MAAGAGGGGGGVSCPLAESRVAVNASDQAAASFRVCSRCAFQWLEGQRVEGMDGLFLFCKSGSLWLSDTFGPLSRPGNSC